MRRYLGVSGYTGSATEIIIPCIYSGKEVVILNSSAFMNCCNITNILIPNSVKIIGDCTFSFCSSLTDIVLPDSIVCINALAFYECHSLTSITMSNNITYIGDYAFSYCNSLAGIIIPDDVNRIGNAAFSGFSSLTSVIIPESVQYLGDNVFQDCDNLIIYCEAANKPDGWADNWNVDNCFVIWDFKYLLTIQNDVSMGIVTGDGEYKRDEIVTVNAFANSDYVFEYWYDDEGTVLSFDSEYQFLMPKNNYNINAKWYTEGLEFILNTATDTYSVYCYMDRKEIIIPEYFNGKKVTEISAGAFYGFNNLTYITIPNSITSIGAYAFYECYKLTKIIIPESVISIGENIIDQYNTTILVCCEAESKLENWHQNWNPRAFETLWNYTRDKYLLVVYENRAGIFVINHACQYEADEIVTVTVYDDDEYSKFLGIYNGIIIVSNEIQYTFTMPDNEYILYALYEYKY